MEEKNWESTVKDCIIKNAIQNGIFLEDLIGLHFVSIEYNGHKVPPVILSISRQDIDT